MRTLIVALAAVALAACTSEVSKAVNEKAAASPDQAWTIQVVGDNEDNVMVVTGPGGKSAAARVTAGASSLLADAEAQGFLAEAQTAYEADPPPEKVSIKAPGVSINVAADETAGENSGRGRVRIDVGGIQVHVDGDEADGEGRGVFRMTGVNADTAREFIEDADDLSPEVKQQMREKLGL